MNNKTPRFLLVRTDRLGDVVLTLPAVGFLRRRYPAARMAFLTRSYTAPLLRHYRGIDQILLYCPEDQHRGLRGLTRLATRLADEHFDEAVLFSPTAALAWTLWCAGIPIRTGTGYRAYSLLLNHRIFEHRKTAQHHELEYNLNLLSRHGSWQQESVRFDFQFTERMEAWWETFCREQGLAGEFAILHPGSGGSSPNLEPGQYRLLLAILVRETRFPILVTGLGAEAPLIEYLCRGLPAERVRPLAGQLSLEQLAMCIAKSSLFISGSTGPLHLADALGVPVLAFFCPAPPCSPARWGPYFQQAWAITPPVEPCRRGRAARCPHGNCLATLSSDRLRETLARRLAYLQQRPTQLPNAQTEKLNHNHDR